MVVVDDNQLTLPGFVAALTTSPDVEVVGAFGHDEALAWAGDWSEVGVVIVDAADEGRTGDQFPGVAVVRRVRAAAEAGGREPLIVVVTGHYLHDGLRHRMAEAQADFYFLRSELRSPEALVDVVLHPDAHRRGVPGVADAGTRRRLGVGPEADVEGFVGFVEERGLGPALDGQPGGRDQPRSRRWARLRGEAAGAGRIEARNSTTGDRPRGQASPSIRQLARLWDWAARVRHHDGG